MPTTHASPTAVRLEQVAKTYVVRTRAGRLRRRRTEVHAVDGISFEVGGGEMVGLLPQGTIPPKWERSGSTFRLMP